MKILYTLAVALALPGVMGLISPCGDPDDPCMNNENWKQCRNLEINGCKGIRTILAGDSESSCPLQFACGDDDEQLERDNEVSIAMSDETVGEPPSACVQLYMYNGKPECFF